MLPTFASHWLIPRIKSFYDRTPDVRVNMGSRTDLFSFEDTHFEAAIHYGKPAWPGTSSDYLFGEKSCRSARRRCSTGVHVEDLLAYPLLHSTTRPARGRSGSRRTASRTSARCRACATSCTRC